MSDSTIRAYVDGVGVDVVPPATVIDAITAASAELAAAVAAGERIVTDSRGLPISGESPLHGGSIFRVLPTRLRAS